MGVCKRFRRSHCAKIRIHHLLTARLSADDRRIAVLNSAFEAKNEVLGHFQAVKKDSLLAELSFLFPASGLRQTAISGGNRLVLQVLALLAQQ